MPTPTVPLYKVENQFTQKVLENKPTIIFIHGNSTSSIVWDHQLQEEKLKTFSMVAFDIPGHGKSPSLKDYSIKNLIQILIENCEQYKSVILIGHSFGGHLVMESLPYLSNCIGSLVFGAPPVKKPINIDVAFLPNEKMGNLFKGDLNKVEVSEFVKILVGENQNWIKPLTTHIKKSDSNFRTSLGGSIANGEFTDEYTILKESKIPIAILQGEKDSLVSVEYLHSLQIPQLWKNKIIIVPKSSHSPNMENPKAFNLLLLEFINYVVK
ncbi:pimeloyl-ACP methyl ester carboxylesterase [Maribacter vaceletii]|uniref:Pimeloyl-ACP methyl ester carboxylesterase n=1 Tax=Maribacter vaceletii TaxID=1206816 RepID=A0A495E8G6_9FLAO|nr:alpha/beta hydrolase [Maribacter vaceletii]RKR13096.1 pimeloyl-ACP methyl ester carboxylesterase [Maribacter vaceletii]